MCECLNQGFYYLIYEIKSSCIDYLNKFAFGLAITGNYLKCRITLILTPQLLLTPEMHYSQTKLHPKYATPALKYAKFEYYTAKGKGSQGQKITLKEFF